ncbi:MAG: hypothetical protein NDJ90_04135 [Oligoflexia bacterium]|nr:hypothetical protein [Oligoflexia bacterium]
MRTLSSAFLPLITMAVLLSSCAPIGRTYVPRAGESSFSRASALGVIDTESSGDFSCPGSPNVVPDYDSENDGSGYFTVCASRTDNAKLFIRGQTARSNTICVFPAQVVDSRHTYWKPELGTGLPWNQCVSAIEDVEGALLTFAGINFNAVFIVEEMDRDQMQLCLGNGNYYGCPAYSFGRFR